jgi:hypothetical protein
LPVGLTVDDGGATRGPGRKVEIRMHHRASLVAGSSSDLRPGDGRAFA